VVERIWEMKDWQSMLTIKDLEVLDLLGDGLGSELNPISEAAQNGNLQHIIDLGYSIKQLCRLATLAQMEILDYRQGPDEDGEPKALRRHWYSWWKTEFAQPYSQLLGQDIQEKAWGDRWASYLSQTYADLVDNEGVTYQDLWVKDASRMMETFWSELFRHSNIIVCVEKDSLFGDFVAASRALGAKVLYSGKGKSSKAAIEKLLREAFHWQDDYDPFIDNPLYVLHISDFDYDGEAVIGPTFAEQCRRYTRNIHEARVGVNPIHLQNAGYNLQESWYEIKMTRKPYKDWARQTAMKILDCDNCGPIVISQKASAMCPQCGSMAFWLTDNTAYGYEVESMRTREYYSLLVNALLSVMPLDIIIEGLRDDCRADLDIATDRIAEEICSNHSQYVSLREEMEELERRMGEFRLNIKQWFWDEGAGHEEDWREEEDDPEESNFLAHVQESNRWSEPWRPFSPDVRTGHMVDWFRESFDDQINDFLEQEIE
jgi:hypothetical protein